MAVSAECVVLADGGLRLVVDLLTRTPEWTHAVESATIEAVEFRHFHFDRQIALEHLDRLFSCAQAPKVRSLHIEDCVLSDRVVAFIVETFIPKNQLATITVRRCRQFSMSSLMAMASLVKVAPLVTLELSCCHLARQAGIMLGQSLQSCHQLRRVDLSDNNLRDGGLKAIADGIRAAQVKGDCLDFMDCSRNGISASGLAALASIRIKHLTVNDNSITAVNPALFSNNSCLESLHVADNDMADEAMRELLTNALQAPQLTELNIQNCGFSEECEALLTKSLLLKAKTAKGCSLRKLHVGDKPNIEEILDDNDDATNPPSSPGRLVELKKSLENRIPGLTVHLLNDELQHGSGDGADDNELTASYDLELETPGRQVRRELLERTEFMRRHSEELPLSDDESLVSFASDKLENRAKSKPNAPKSTTTSFTPLGDSDNDLLSVSRRPSSSSMLPQSFHHSTGNGSFFLNNNPSLDDVASQFSIDPPPSAMTSTLQSADVEFIVSRTIETMNRNFEQRMTQFLMRMEFQQQEKNATQLQSLAAKVEACERAIPRLEARLDVLADRIATSGAQVVKMQSEWQTKQQSTASVVALATSTPLTLVMQSQVEEHVAARLRSAELATQSELSVLRREVATASAATKAANPQAVVEAVSVHLSQFKQEFDGNQATVLRRFTENIVRDGARVDERMQQLESKVSHLEGVIQAEQHASLLALEAISEAFAGKQHGYTLASR